MENVISDRKMSVKKGYTKLFKLLKQVAKFMICFVLCISLVFGYSYKKPVEVQAVSVGTAMVAGYVVAGVIMAALGVHIVASIKNESSQELLNNIWVNSGLRKTVGDGVEGIKEGGRTVLKVTTDMIKAIDTELRKAWVVSANFKEITKYFKVTKYNGYANKTDIQNMLVNSSIPVTLGASAVVNSFKDFDIRQSISTTSTKYLLNESGTAYITTSGYSNNSMFYQYNAQSEKLVMYFPAFLVSYLYNDVLVYSVMYLKSDGSKWSLLNPDDTQFKIWTGQIPVSSNIGDSTYKDASRDKFYWDGYTAGLHTQDEVIDRLKERVGKLEADGTVSVPLVNTGSNVYVDGNNRTQTQDRTLDTEVSSEAEKAEATQANTEAGTDTSVPQPNMPDISLPKLITKKFPFSLPWDLYGAFKNLVSPAQAPKFVYPFEISRLGIHQSITIDFSGYETLASISRWGFGIAFVVWLILITRKMIGSGG